MKKVNLQVMRPWIAKRVVDLVGFEDEVVVEYAMGLLEDTSKAVGTYFLFTLLPKLMHCANIQPDPKAMQINLTGFLESKVSSRCHFC
jgi:serine/arginine repetitive matrix protein 1